MSTIETPAAALTAEEQYVRSLLGEDVTALEASAAAFAAGVGAGDFEKDRRLAMQRLDARRALDLADEVRPRDRELSAQQKALVDAEAAAIAEVEAELRAEFERKLAEATEAAQAPLAEFKATNAAEQAELAKIARAAREGRDLLVRSADPKIDEAITRLQRGDIAIWGGLAISRQPGDPINFAAIERANERQREIERLKLLKLRPQCFAHAASSEWRTFDPAEVAS